MGARISAGFARWGRKSLTTKFLVAGSLVMIATTIPAAWVIGNIAEVNLLFHRAAATALFMDNVVAPELQGLNDGPLSPAEIARVDALLDDPDLTARIPHFEVWMPDGTVAFSRDADLIGRQFPLPAPATRALQGQVEVGKADLGAGEHVVRDFKQQYLEIYAPLHGTGTGEIYAVMELHEDLGPLEQNAWEVVRTAWVVVVAAMLALFGTMFMIVRGGARTIDAQKSRLELQLGETHRLAQRNSALHEQAVEAARLKVELHENLLRSIGSDLHDGPAQLLAFSSVKLESLRRTRDESARLLIIDDLENKLREVQDDIRDLATGFVVPGIEQLSIDTVVMEAISFSERRMGVAAHLKMSKLDVPCSRAFKMCVYRFIQEGLNNVWSHGGGVQANILVELRDQTLCVLIQNVVTADKKASRPRRGLGIRALKIRAESLNGSVWLSLSSEIAELGLVLPLETIHA